MFGRPYRTENNMSLKAFSIETSKYRTKIISNPKFRMLMHVLYQEGQQALSTIFMNCFGTK